MASAQLVEMPPEHRGGVPIQTGQRGRARGGFLEEAVLELSLKTRGGVSPEGNILVKDTKCAEARRRGCVRLIYGTPGSQ